MAYSLFFLMVHYRTVQKPLSIAFVFQKKSTPWRRWVRGMNWLVDLKFARFVPLTRSFIFYYLLFIYLTKEFSGSAGKRWLCWRPRPGFEPQVCIILHIIFQSRFTCRSTYWGLWCTSKSNVTRPSQDQTKGWDWRYTLNSGQYASRLPGKSNGSLGCWARISQSNLPFGDYHPPGLQFSIFFLYFIFNCYFIFFICLN